MVFTSKSTSNRSVSLKLAEANSSARFHFSFFILSLFFLVCLLEITANQLPTFSAR